MTDTPTARWFRRFADHDANGASAVYADWADGVADDPALLELLDRLPMQKRQPPLVFAVSRFVGAPVGRFTEWRAWMLAHWPIVEAELLLRYTQTNEPRRCAALLPALARIEGPIALLEVGASAGLCLYPDRYSYDYDGVRIDPADGPSPVVLRSAVSGGVPLPSALPTVIWRAGIDLDPLDVHDPLDARWLETLVWPEQEARLELLRGAMAVARAEPPLLVLGDAVDALAALAARAPSDATLVVVSSGVLVYLPGLERQRFVDAVGALDAHWVSLEGAAVLTGIADELEQLTDAETDGRYVLALDGHPLAFVGPHGQSVEWIDPVGDSPPGA